MNLRDNKFELGIAALVVVCVGGFVRMLGFFGSEEKVQDVPEISYEMPRPKDQTVGEFGLDGREIDRRYVNPFEKNKQAEEAKKPADQAAKAVAPAAKMAQAAAAAAQPGFYLRKKADFNVVDKNARSLTDSPAASPNKDNSVFTGADRTTAATDQDQNKDILSPAQWRSLLLAQPTKENMEKLITALSKKEVDEHTFDSIMSDLLKSQKKEDESLAMYGLNRVPTAGSFAVIAHDYDGLSTDIKPAAQQFMMSYTATSRHSALKQSLQSSDQNVAINAAKVVLAGIQSQGNSAASQDPRQVRGQGAISNANSYSDFKSIFQTWSQSSNSSLQSIASSILALLPATQA